MAVISVHVEKSGRILIPAAVRRQLGIKEGESDLLLHIDERPIRVSSRAQALVEVQAIFAKYGSSDRLWSEELSADRRQEARREDTA
jgi:AbrB family transcriptional regulator, stage V sporulation protein T